MAKKEPDVTVWVGIYADHGSAATPPDSYDEVMVAGRYFEIVRGVGNHPIGFGIVLASRWPESQADGQIAAAEERVPEVQARFDEWNFPHQAGVCTLTRKAKGGEP